MKNKSPYTIIRPKDVPNFNLPCNVLCTFGGDLQKQKTVFFENPSDKTLLAMTISSEPELVDTPEKCSLTDEQIRSLRYFIKNKKMIFDLYYRGVISKKEFIRAIKDKRNIKHELYIWIRNFDIYKGCNPIKLIFKWFAGKMWDYQDARDLEYVFTNKNQTPANKCSFFRYLILSLFFNDREPKQEE